MLRTSESVANAQLRTGGDARGVTIIEVPGANLHAVPPFSCSLPPGWSAEEAPGALVVVRPPASGEMAEVVAELRIETVRVSVTTRLADLATAALARRRRRVRDLTVVTQKLGRFGATPAHLCGAAWTDAAGGRTAQLQVVILAPAETGRTVVDALILTGVCTEAHAPALVPEYVRIASSIHFGSTGPTVELASSSAAPDPFTTAAP